MTRKDYIAIAEALTVSREFAAKVDSDHDGYGISGVDDCAFRISQALASDNPRFDRTHFLAVVRGEKELNSRPKKVRPARCHGCGKMLAWTSKDGWRHQFDKGKCQVTDDELQEAQDSLAVPPAHKAVEKFGLEQE